MVLWEAWNDAENGAADGDADGVAGGITAGAVQLIVPPMVPLMARGWCSRQCRGWHGSGAGNGDAAGAAADAANGAWRTADSAAQPKTWWTRSRRSRQTICQARVGTRNLYVEGLSESGALASFYSALTSTAALPAALP